MVKYIQELSLQAELPPFTKGNGLGKRQVIIPEMRSLKPGVKSKYSRCGILAHIGKMRVASARPSAAKGGVDRILKGAGCASRALRCSWLENTDRILQLGNG